MYTGGQDRSITTGNGYTKRTLFFDPKTFDLVPYPDILKERGGHCMIVYKNVIYIFGGTNGNFLRDCEKFENNEW